MTPPAVVEGKGDDPVQVEAKGKSKDPTEVEAKGKGNSKDPTEVEAATSAKGPSQDEVEPCVEHIDSSVHWGGGGDFRGGLHKGGDGGGCEGG